MTQLGKLSEFLQPQPSDMPSKYYREPGEVGCYCSRCLSAIGEDCHPVLLFSAHSKYAFRYHPECLGLKTDGLYE